MGMQLTVCKAHWGPPDQRHLGTQVNHEFPFLDVLECSWRKDLFQLSLLFTLWKVTHGTSALRTFTVVLAGDTQGASESMSKKQLRTPAWAVCRGLTYWGWGPRVRQHVSYGLSALIFIIFWSHSTCMVLWETSLPFSWVCGLDGLPPLWA